METLGAALGSKLLPAETGNNDKGFFEDVDINRINIEVMHAAGFDWDAMTPIDLSRIDEHHLDELRLRAATVLREKCDSKIFALKDPRISRLLPFWQPIFASLQSRVVYAIAVRNPISVARSLAKRNGFAEEKAHTLWLAHTVSALEATVGLTRTLVSYDLLMNAPRPELERVSSELGLPLIDSEVESFERTFLDDNLRHTRFDPQDLHPLQTLPRQAKALFSALDEAVRNRLPPENVTLGTAIANARTYLDDIEPLLRYEWQLDRRAHSAQQSARACNEALQEQIRATESLASTIESLSSAIRAGEQQQQTLSETLQSIRTQFEVARQTLAASEIETATLRAKFESLLKSQAEILTSTSWRVTSPLRAVRRLLTRI
ncbi:MULTISPECIES: hypothetical protein [unclassified Burkholderia]|uniref:hypothetical protein n=1 Tax=unclassified Burkholderia TaxID=2613784 RepID=UPI002AB19891|nr:MULTISPECIES: hypothetical protein [unclassified Burkholderia]